MEHRADCSVRFPDHIRNLHYKSGDRNGPLVNCMENTHTCEIYHCGFSVNEGSKTYGELLNSSTASGSSTTVQARQTRPRSQFGQIRGLGLAAAAGVSYTIGYEMHLPCQ